MITDARSQGGLIAALHLESLFNAGQSVGDKSNRATYVEPAIQYANEHDAVQLRQRLEFIRSLAVSAQGLSIKTDMAKAVSLEKSRAAAFRAAANVATWRTYLPDECVVAMVNDGWHWST
jgi:hypothetical protein